MKYNNIDKLKKDFFYKNISVGHHNSKYSQFDIIHNIIQVCKNSETIGEYCISPSSDTVYRRLILDIDDLIKSFQEVTLPILKYAVKRYPRERWEIIVDPTDELFYGKKGDEYVIGTKEGKKCFRFKHIIVSCRKIRIPVAIVPLKKGANKVKILQSILEKILKIVKPFNFLADAGFGSGEVIKLIQKLRLPYIIRIKAVGEIKRYIEQGKTSEVHCYELKDKSKVWFHTKFGVGKNGKCWALATSHYRTYSNHLWDWYSRRWKMLLRRKTE